MGVEKQINFGSKRRYQSGAGNQGKKGIMSAQRGPRTFDLLVLKDWTVPYFYGKNLDI